MSSEGMAISLSRDRHGTRIKPLRINSLEI